MKIIREQINEKIVRITTVDERWYSVEQEDKSFIYLPSSTWICSYYPKGKAFYRWLMEKGWEAEEIKNLAGERGSKVHQACEQLDLGQAIPINAQFANPKTGLLEELSIEEADAIISFRDWLDFTKPQLIANEMMVLGYEYAGTLDRIYKINGVIWIVDLKTSQHIWEEMILQISSYSHANIDYRALGITDDEWKDRKLAVLQLGYKLNKKFYKFTEIPDKFELFQMAYAIWLNENPASKPKQKDYPMIIESEARKEKNV